MSSKLLPNASHPPTQSVISANKLNPPRFPYDRLGALPDLNYAFENAIISLFTIFTSLLDFLFTLYVWIPIGLLRSFSELIIDPLLSYTNRSTVDPQALNFTPRVIIISGASSGIGANLVQAYASTHTSIIILGRDLDRLNHVSKLARSLGCPEVETHSIDYNHQDAEKQIRSVLDHVKHKYGVIDEVLAVTGTVTFTDDHQQPEAWGAKTAKRLNTVNVMSSYAFIMKSWEIMKTQRKGKICIISSSAALFGPPQFAIYGATKANLLSFSQSLRSLSTAYNITISCICPGFIESGMTSDMLSAGSTMPSIMLADTFQMAQRIKRATEKEEAVVIWPLNQVLPLLLASKLNFLNADLGRWVASKIGVTGEMVS